MYFLPLYPSSRAYYCGHEKPGFSEQCVYKACSTIYGGCDETALQEVLFLGICYTFCYASVTFKNM